MAGRADFWFRGTLHHKVNVLVVCDDKLGESHPSVDSTYMLEDYRLNGAIPRVAVAGAECLDDTCHDGKPALCGGEFCFQFYPISLLPDQENAPLNEVLAPMQPASKYAQAWNNLDASIVAPYLDKDFHYSSAWVFDELPCRTEYLEYFEGKLDAMRRAGAAVRAEVGEVFWGDGREWPQGQGSGFHRVPDTQVAVLIRGEIDGEDITTALVLQTRGGRITAARMMGYGSAD